MRWPRAPTGRGGRTALTALFGKGFERSRRWVRATPLPQFGAVQFVLLVCAILIVLDAANVWSLRAKQLATAEKEAVNLARSLGQQAEDTVRTADIAIIGLVQRLDIDGTGGETLEKLRQIMMARLDAFPALA